MKIPASLLLMRNSDESIMMLTVNHLSKNYGDITPIQDLNFTLHHGEIIGLLGANGAGKSTTLNMISGFFPPKSGTITLNNLDSVSDALEYKKYIGYLPEIPPLYYDMTAREQLQMVCSIKGIPRKRQRQEINKVSSLCRIEDVIGRMNRNMSKGYKQRIGLAQALIGNPDLLILDEPTAGLDPQQIIDFRQLIEGLKKEQMLIISSHILSEIAAVASRVLVLNNGIIAADSPVGDLVSPSTGNTLLEARIHGDSRSVSPLIKNLEGVISIEVKGSLETGCKEYTITMEEHTDIRKELFSRLAENGFPLMQLNMKNPTLEEFFIELTSGQQG